MKPDSTGDSNGGGNCYSSISISIGRSSSITIVKPMTLETKLRLEYEQLFEESFALMQLNKYSVEEGRFLFPDINLEVYRKNQHLKQIARELLTGVKTKSSLIEDVILG